MSNVARDTGLSRKSLYRALSGERKPGFETIICIMFAANFGLGDYYLTVIYLNIQFHFLRRQGR